jgi:hypothetical protein
MTDLSLSLLVLKTRQMEKMRAFYGALGIDLAEEQHGKGPVHYAGRVGAAVLEVYPLPEEGTPTDTTTRLGFTVKQLSVAVERLQALGISVGEPPPHIHVLASSVLTVYQKNIHGLDVVERLAIWR